MNKRERAKRDKIIAANIAKLKAKVLRDIKKRLRIMEQNAGIMFVSFRLNLHPEQCHKMLAGETNITLDQLSDLALAVGCRLDVKFTKRDDAASSPTPTEKS